VLLGRNGAGKTTTLRSIMGLWRATPGRIWFDGEDISARATPEIAQRGIAYVPRTWASRRPHRAREHDPRRAREGQARRRHGREKLDWIFGLFPAIKKFWQHPAGLLSGGQKQMLAWRADR